VVYERHNAVPAELLPQIPLDADDLNDVPAPVLRALEDQLANTSRHVDAARVAVIAAQLLDAAGDRLSAAQCYVRAFSIDRSNSTAADGIVETSPAIWQHCAQLQDKCTQLQLQLHSQDVLSHGANSHQLEGFLKPSCSGSQADQQWATTAGLRPAQELQDAEAAVTCVCFGQERLHRAYILLATAMKDGTGIIYRLYRTQMELAMLSDQNVLQGEGAQHAYPPPESNISVHSRLVGHSRAVTSIFFSPAEDELVTTSIDRTVRVWNVASGQMLKVFVDKFPILAAVFLPSNHNVFVAANSNAMLRLVNIHNAMVQQKLKAESEVRALKFDDTGVFLLAGTKNGGVDVLEASGDGTLRFKFKLQLARGSVTCITFVPAMHGQPARLLVNTSDSSVAIVNCMYGPPAGVLTGLVVRSRVKVAHSLLPLKCCYSPSGQGFLVSASEDKEIYIYSLAESENYTMSRLTHHEAPVVAVATNLQDTVMVSADSLGHVALWRRLDFSRLTE